MKKNFIYLSIAALLVLFAACKKDDSNNTNTNNTPGTITLNGTVYTQNQGVFQTSSLNGSSYATFAAAGNNGGKKGVMLFFFPGTSKPTAGSYAISSDVTKDFAGKEVGIIAGDSTGVSHSTLLTGQPGKSVTVTVSSAGKLTVTLSNVTFKGTNFDNSDPNNTQTTDVTESGSATVKEQ